MISRSTTFVAIQFLTYSSKLLEENATDGFGTIISWAFTFLKSIDADREPIVKHHLRNFRISVKDPP